MATSAPDAEPSQAPPDERAGVASIIAQFECLNEASHSNSERRSGGASKDPCPVCLEPYHHSERGRKAKILPCFHIVCLSCLQEIVKGDSFKCPLCRQIVLVPSEGPDAFFTNCPKTRRDLGLPQDPAQWFRNGEIQLNPQQRKNKARKVVSQTSIAGDSQRAQQSQTPVESVTSDAPTFTFNDCNTQ